MLNAVAKRFRPRGSSASVEQLFGLPQELQLEGMRIDGPDANDGGSLGRLSNGSIGRNSSLGRVSLSGALQSTPERGLRGVSWLPFRRRHSSSASSDLNFGGDATMTTSHSAGNLAMMGASGVTASPGGSRYRRRSGSGVGQLSLGTNLATLYTGGHSPGGSAAVAAANSPLLLMGHPSPGGSRFGGFAPRGHRSISESSVGSLGLPAITAAGLPLEPIAEAEASSFSPGSEMQVAVASRSSNGGTSATAMAAAAGGGLMIATHLEEEEDDDDDDAAEGGTVVVVARAAATGPQRTTITALASNGQRISVSPSNRRGGASVAPAAAAVGVSEGSGTNTAATTSSTKEDALPLTLSAGIGLGMRASSSVTSLAGLAAAAAASGGGGNAISGARGGNWFGAFAASFGSSSSSKTQSASVSVSSSVADIGGGMQGATGQHSLSKRPRGPSSSFYIGPLQSLSSSSSSSNMSSLLPSADASDYLQSSPRLLSGTGTAIIHRVHSSSSNSSGTGGGHKPRRASGLRHEVMRQHQLTEPLATQVQVAPAPAVAATAAIGVDAAAPPASPSTSAPLTLRSPFVNRLLSLRLPTSLVPPASIPTSNPTAASASTAAAQNGAMALPPSSNSVLLAAPPSSDVRSSSPLLFTHPHLRPVRIPGLEDDEDEEEGHKTEERYVDIGRGGDKICAVAELIDDVDMAAVIALQAEGFKSSAGQGRSASFGTTLPLPSPSSIGSYTSQGDAAAIRGSSSSEGSDSVFDDSSSVASDLSSAAAAAAGARSPVASLTAVSAASIPSSLPGTASSASGASTSSSTKRRGPVALLAAQVVAGLWGRGGNVSGSSNNSVGNDALVSATSPPNAGSSSAAANVSRRSGATIDGKTKGSSKADKAAKKPVPATGRGATAEHVSRSSSSSSASSSAASATAESPRQARAAASNTTASTAPSFLTAALPLYASSPPSSASSPYSSGNDYRRGGIPRIPTAVVGGIVTPLPLPPEASNSSSSISIMMIGAYSVPERLARLARLEADKAERGSTGAAADTEGGGGRVRYLCRKTLAEVRERVGGRFIKKGANEDVEGSAQPAAAPANGAAAKEPAPRAPKGKKR